MNHRLNVAGSGNPPSLADPVGPYAHVRVATAPRLAFISGQVGSDTNGAVAVGTYDQTLAVFSNLDRVLEYLGATPNDVVKLLTFLDQRADFADFARARSEVYRRWFPNGEAYPSHSAAVAARLANDALLVEVEGVVELPE